MRNAVRSVGAGLSSFETRETMAVRKHIHAQVNMFPLVMHLRSLTDFEHFSVILLERLLRNGVFNIKKI